jgi:hypothetical protein
MSNELSVVKKEINDVVGNIDYSVIEQVLLKGDLSKLKDKERVEYYSLVCRSLNLNPITRPFEYIHMKSGLTLYAKKECTDQLRYLNKVSITKLTERVIDDIYIVTAEACTPGGRTDQSQGAVSIQGLKGENKANAFMKAETKAKRRATLSICGLGFVMDETEVDSVKDAKRIKVNHDTGEILEALPEIEVKNESYSQTEEKKPPEPRKITQEFTDFVKKWSLVMNSDGTCSNAMKFLKESGEKMNKNYFDTIDQALKNQVGFENAFKKWEKQNCVDKSFDPDNFP